MTSLSKITHVGWTYKGPELLTLGRRKWPRTFHPAEGWYHDYPTVILAGTSLLEGAVRGSRPRVAGLNTAIGLGAGVAYHALSVCVMARRLPRYSVPYASRADLAQTVAIAASEEVIWRADGGRVETLVDSIGFGLTHLTLGSVQGAAHMAVFSQISRWLERKHGLSAAILFHSAYNVAHACESRRGEEELSKL